MIIFLRIAFSLVLVAMLGVTTWASLQVALWETPASVIGHPWFIATLFDTYFAFLAVWLWVAYMERSWVARIAWLLGILILGNMAIAAWFLIQLFRVPANAGLEVLFTRKP